MKRFLIIVLVLSVVFSLSIPGIAAESVQTVTPRYTCINTLNARLAIDERFGLAACNTNAGFSGGSSMVLTCKLQQYNGSTWVTLKSWSESSAYSIAINKNYAVASGYKYRLRVSCSVYNSSGTLLDSGYIYSNEVVY